jgi:hypothetical protein
MRPRMTIGFALAITLCVALPASADVLNRTAANGKLPVRQPNLAVYSYNGRVWVAPTPTQAPVRSRDPMAVRVTNVDSGTKLTLYRQARSNALCELNGPHKYTCGDLQALAGKAVVWKDGMELHPAVDSPNEVFVRIEKEPGKVWWPDSRVKLSGKTRDGQALPDVVGSVQGLQDQNESRYNFQTMSQQNWRISGRYLPSARAWLQAENLLISEPTQDTASIKQGQGLVRKGKLYQRAAEHMTTWIASMQQAINRGDFSSDPAKQQKIQTAIQKVQQHLNYGPKSAQTRQPLVNLAAQLQQQGEQMIKAGEVIRSVMFSVGAMPVLSNVTLANQRLINDGSAAMRSCSANSDACGFAKAEIGGVSGDKVRATISFARNGNGAKVGSTLDVDFTIPDGTQKPSLEVDGVKFYKVRPTASAIHNDPADAQ